MTAVEKERKPTKEISVENQLVNILGISENIEEDLEYLVDRATPGSCQWLLQLQSFQDWASDNPSTPGLLWLTGNPGSGKSIMASSIISSLKKRSFAGTCQYHFFLAGHQTKRTLAYLLRSVALQIAQSHGVFCSRVLELHENTGIIFSQQKENFIWEKIFEGILFRLPSQEPLFWVFDGLDEAESPSDLIRFVSRIKAATRINVLLISRATKDLLKNMNNYLPTTVHEVISADDVVNDIKDYVRSSIQKIIPSNRAQEEVVKNILCKASGSFLWVKLALDRIRDNWYTEDDIKAALTEMPEGMQSMYERMIEVIAGQSSKVCQMATRILIWVACSFRPLEIAEIKVALEPEFKGFVNLEQTIEEICGHFVVVKKLKITLIHETASQFLRKKTSNLRIAIVENEGHEHIARVCISFLSDATKWRRVFSAIEVNQQLKSMSGGVATFDGHPFLFYALTFWAYHVSLAPVDSDDLLEVVLTFLEEYCLVWINGIGLFRNLRILTNAAQNLKKYSKRRANSVAKRPPHSFKMSRDIELRQWANDLIRLFGRFGNNIAEIPSSIHKYVIPFCPKDSIISKSFSHVGRSTFSVTGMSSRHWDDCLARLTMGEDRTASKVFCKDTFFVTLVGVDGTLIIWHSETCQELRRFAHGEYVTQLASSKTTNFIATAGFKTTRIWDITTGEEVRRLPKERYHHTRALAFSAEDDDILVAYDDCSVQCFNIVTGQEKWRFLAKDPNSKDHNCARYMAFSPDLAQIAIVFRGRPLVVWGIQPSQISHISPKKCVVMEDRMRSAVEGDAWNAPEIVVWQPDSDHLLILYEDTKVVDWNITDDEQMQYDHTGARGMVLSPDGNLVLTSDVNGTLSIWTIPEFRLTYQLKYEELVMDLAFSPDGTRFYDIRGSFCNVWEPDALVRPNDIDQDNTSSNYETIASEPVISSDDNTRTPITALVGDSLDRAYCCGKDDGTVVMYDIPEGRKLRKIISHSSSVSIIKLAWSDSEKFLASADDSGRVIAKRLEPPTDRQGKWAVFPVFDKRIEEAVEQLLFSAREEFILIAGRTTSCVMNLKSKKELCCVRHPNQSVGLWVTHPSNPLMLVRLDASQENEYFWKTLAPKDTSIESAVQATHFTETSDILQQTIQCRAHWLVFEVVIAVSHHAGSPNRRIEAYDLRKLHESRSHETSARYRIEGLAKHVRRLIGCFQDRVVFIDHQFWLCTWKMERVYSKHKRHFFLPKDWLSSTALRLMVLNTSGTLLCPRNREVAIVRSGFKY